MLTELGVFIRQARLIKGIRLREMAKYMEVSSCTQSAWECGFKKPTNDEIKLMAYCLMGISREQAKKEIAKHVKIWEKIREKSEKLRSKNEKAQ